jgi:hypothetical protein
VAATRTFPQENDFDYDTLTHFKLEAEQLHEALGKLEVHAEAALARDIYRECGPEWLLLLRGSSVWLISKHLLSGLGPLSLGGA